MSLKNFTEQITSSMGNKYEAFFIFIASFFIMLSAKLSPNIDSGMNFEVVDVRTYELFPLNLLDYFLWILIFIALKSIIHNSVKYICANNRKITKLPFKFFVAVAAFIFLAWIPYFLAFYPGTSFVDEYYSLLYPFAMTHQPIVYSLLLHYTWKWGVYFGIPNIGFAFLTLFRMFIMATSFSYLIYFLHKRAIPIWFLSLSILIFAFLPIFPNTAITIQKDGLFSIFLMLLTLFLYKNKDNLSIIVTEKKSFLVFLCLSFPVLWLRGNGIYVLLGSIILFYVFEKKYMIRFLALAILFFIISSIPNFFRTVPFKENLGIPFQQIGRVLCVNGEISESAKKDFANILDLSTWKENYNPTHSDDIKWFSNGFNEKWLNENKGRFFKAYVETFPKNISTYFSAHAFATLDFWCIGPWNKYHNQIAHVDAITNFTLTLEKPYWPFERPVYVSDLKVFKKPVREKIAKFMADNVFYLNGGVCGFILLFVMAIIIEMKETRRILAVLPVFLSYLTILAASPTAFAFRYVLYLAFLMPFIVSLPFMVDEDEQKENS